MRTIKFLTLLIIIMANFSIQAQTDSVVVDSIRNNPMFNMNLNSILDVDVNVVSKKTEKTSIAPGMVTSYNASEIERYGYYTLKDLSNITSGYSSFSAYGETNLETRGQKAGSWNVSKHLLMVDGIPINHGRANSAPLEYQIPLFFADKVEFLKGPSSALYGTSAFYGVMNIKSKSVKGEGTLSESKISYGDRGQGMRLMSNVLIADDKGETKLMFSGYKRGFSGDQLGVDSDVMAMDNDNSLFLNSSYTNRGGTFDGLGIGLMYLKRNSHGGEFWIDFETGPLPSPVNEVTWEEIIPYIKYNKQITDKVKVNGYGKFNSSTEKSTHGNYGDNVLFGYNYTTNNLEMLMELDYQIDKKTNVIYGINLDSRHELGSPESYDWDITEYTDTNGISEMTFNQNMYEPSQRVSIVSLFTQYKKEMDVLKGLIFTLGARMDNSYSEYAEYSQLSPRIGVVQRITKKFNIKMLYGRALRVPNVKEIGLNDETTDRINANGGNLSVLPDNLLAEVIESYEFGLNYNTKKLSVATAIFYNNTVNALDGFGYSFTTNGGEDLTVNYFDNVSGNISAYGGEFDLKYVANKNLYLMANHAYAKATIHDNTPFFNVPTNKTNGSISYMYDKDFKMTTTIVARHIWSMVVDPEIYGTTSLGGYTLLDANVSFPINNRLYLEVQVRNILDTEWKQPSLLGNRAMIPLAGRNYLITSSFRF